MLKYVGIMEINGETIIDLVSKFEEISTSWIIPKNGSDEEMMGFIFGNQGLVLLYLLWSLSAFLGLTEIANRVKKIPNLCNSAFSRFILFFYMIIFVLYFLPGLASLSLLIPFFASKVVGYALGIMLGAFAFCLIIHRILSFFLALSYLFSVILNTNINRDCININNASLEELTLLPGIGFKLAKKIINGRPFSDICDLANIEGLGSQRLKSLKELIRI